MLALACIRYLLTTQSNWIFLHYPTISLERLISITSTVSNILVVFYDSYIILSLALLFVGQFNARPDPGCRLHCAI